MNVVQRLQSFVSGIFIIICLFVKTNRAQISLYTRIFIVVSDLKNTHVIFLEDLTLNDGVHGQLKQLRKSDTIQK
jgi:hypothetical protein